MPGCLGLDAMWQLVGFYLGWLGQPGKGRALGVGEVKFTGQILDTIKKVTYHISLKRLILRKLILGVADGVLKADGQPIYEGSGHRSKHATIINGRWLSGDIILKVYPKCFEAFVDEHRDREKEREELLGRLGDYGWQVNPETGKLQKL